VRGGTRVVVALVSCLALAACASEGTGLTDERSNTPRVTVGEPADDVADLLLAARDVEAVDGLQDAAASDVDDIEVYENPDPRGPCGARLDAPPTPDAGRVLTAGGITALQLVYADASEIDRHVDVLEGDLRPGCGPHESLTNFGAVQQVAEPVALDTTGVGDRAVGWTTAITVDGETAYAGLVLAIGGGHATGLQVLAGHPVGSDTMLSLARAAVARLER
jgi:hypothetical protein